MEIFWNKKLYYYQGHSSFGKDLAENFFFTVVKQLK